MQRILNKILVKDNEHVEVMENIKLPNHIYGQLEAFVRKDILWQPHELQEFGVVFNGFSDQRVNYKQYKGQVLEI